MKEYRFSILNRLALFIAISLVTLFQLNAQDKQTLESKRNKILEDIRYTERLLNTTQKNVQANVSDLSTIKRKITLREKLIGNLAKEMNLLERNVITNQLEIDELETKLSKLKASYSSSIYKSYKYQKANQQLMFVLGADNLNQAVRRMNYLRKISQARKEQAREIKAAKILIEKKIAELEVLRENKKGIISEQKVQLNTMSSEKKSINGIVVKLKKEEKKYKDDIGKKQKERAKLDKQIQVIIEKEIALNQVKTKSKDGLSYTPSPDELQLSKDFTLNKGKLPWPVEKGYVSRDYGIYMHPELNLQMNNTGIDIRTDENAAVRSVFKGEVVTVMSNPTFKNAVIIKHGDYFSVYTGLGKVNVSKGDKVNTKQVIGTAYSEVGQATEVHLEIWNGKTKTNPESWIYKN